MNRLRRYTAILLGWILIAPIAKLMRRRNDMVAVMGRGDGLFVENTKYFYLEATHQRPDVRLVFVTEHAEIASLLRDNGYEALLYPSVRGVMCLLRTGSAIIDAERWTAHYRRYLVCGAKLVQLWHGVPLKKVQLAMDDNCRRPLASYLRGIKNRLNHKIVSYDLVVATSQFYLDEVFAPSFRSRSFLITGYPRNTFGKTLPPSVHGLVAATSDSHIIGKCELWRQEGKRMVMVAPTFRDTRKTPMKLEPSTLVLLDQWCDDNNVELVFKFHPREKGAYDIEGNHLHVSDKYADSYPLLPLADALISDYSSIYFDYLWVDRPILFFVPDLDEYKEKDRDLFFSYDEMTPGPKAGCWPHVLKQLAQQLDADEYREDRLILRKKLFDEIQPSQGTMDILDFMVRSNWLIRETNQASIVSSH